MQSTSFGITNSPEARTLQTEWLPCSHATQIRCSGHPITMLHRHTEGTQLKMLRFIALALPLSLFLFFSSSVSIAQVEGEHIATSAAHPVASTEDTETSVQHDARMAWWAGQVRFGLFIHWGLYSSLQALGMASKFRGLESGS